MTTDIGFGCTLEIINGEDHTSVNLRNDWVRRTTKLGQVKNA